MGLERMLDDAQNLLQILCGALGAMHCPRAAPAEVAAVLSVFRVGCSQLANAAAGRLVGCSQIANAAVGRLVGCSQIANAAVGMKRTGSLKRLAVYRLWLALTIFASSGDSGCTLHFLHHGE